MRTLWQSPAKLIIISSMDNPAVAEYLREICAATARISHFRIMRPGRMDDTCSTFVAAVAADSSMGGSSAVPHMHDSSFVSVSKVDYKNKRSAPHRIEVCAIQVARRPSGPPWPTLDEIKEIRKENNYFWKNVRGILAPVAPERAAVAAPTLTVMAGFFPERESREMMKKVAHELGFGDLICQYWTYRVADGFPGQRAHYPAFLAVRGNYKHFLSVGADDPPEWDSYARLMNDEAAVAALEEDLVVATHWAAKPRAPPEDDKKPFTSFGTVKLKSPNLADLVEKKNPDDPDKHKWLEPGIHNLLLFVGQSRKGIKSKAKAKAKKRAKGRGKGN